MGYSPYSIAEGYRPRCIDALRPDLALIEAYILEQAGNMIKSFGHKGLQAFFERGTKAGIRPDHASKLARLLARLDVAIRDQEMNLPGWGLHPLSNDLKGHFPVC